MERLKKQSVCEKYIQQKKEKSKYNGNFEPYWLILIQ